MLASRASSAAIPTTTMIRVRFIRWVLPFLFLIFPAHRRRAGERKRRGVQPRYEPDDHHREIVVDGYAHVPERRRGSTRQFAAVIPAEARTAARAVAAATPPAGAGTAAGARPRARRRSKCSCVIHARPNSAMPNTRMRSRGMTRANSTRFCPFPVFKDRLHFMFPRSLPTP